MTSRPRIAVFGSAHMDLIALAGRLPDKATSGLAHGFVSGLGGKGGNQAAECAGAGALAFMVTRFGEDEFGRTLHAILESRGVDCRAISWDGAGQTGASTVLSAPEGYTSLIYPGAAATMTVSQVKGAIASLAPLGMLIVQSELPLHLSVAAAQQAKTDGARIVFNASPPQASGKDLDQLLQLSDVVVVNATEAIELCGTSDSATLARTLHCTAVITHGAEGSTASNGTESWTQSALPVAVQSTVGAGDAFLAGLCVALCQGREMPAALGAASAAAARKLSASSLDP